MKVVKILGVVFGALFLLTGIGLLAGSAVVGAGQSEFDEQLAQQGLAGPVEGRVTAVEGTIYTVDYTDRQGTARTGTGPVADGTTPPAQGAEVDLYYSTVDPTQIIILDFPGGDFAGIAGALRTAGIICLVIGAILLLAGIVGLVLGRQRAAVPAGPAAHAGAGQVPPDQGPPGQVPPGQGPPGQSPTTQDPPPSEGQAYPPQAAAGAQPGPDIDPTPTQSFPEGQTPTAPPDSNRPG